ncbi:MAG: F0F1-type ATP synthase assembly protein I [Planctomycetota bacterium]|jgi:F0F1-type ATP synthase assembly protein I
MSNKPRTPSDPGEPDPDPLARNEYGRYAGMGFTFALTIMAFAWFGWWIDGKLGTTPLCLFVGVLAGFSGGLISMIKRVPPARRRSSKAESDSAETFDDAEDRNL